jgi:hypothetical protein
MEAKMVWVEFRLWWGQAFAKNTILRFKRLVNLNFKNTENDLITTDNSTYSCSKVQAGTRGG